MVADQQQTVMRRKTQAGRALHQSRTVSVLKALRLTLSKVGNDLFSLPLATLGGTQDVVELEDCATVFKDDHLLILLDGPQGTRGAAMVDPVLVGGLIQQQTMATVRPAVEGASRALTETDASLVAPMINALLKRAAKLPEAEDDRVMLEGFQFGAKAQDVRLLMLALEAHQFHIIRLTLDMAKGARQGELLFCLPVRETAPTSDGTDAEEDGNDLPSPPKTLAASVMSLEASLLVSLAQITIPISRASALRVGQTLELGHVSFENALLRTQAGKVLASGVLGKVNGMRALRLKHRAKKRDTPQRRASDIDTLIKEGVYETEFEASYAAQELPSISEPQDVPFDPAIGESDNEEMPDMSDLPGMEDETILSPSRYKIG